MKKVVLILTLLFIGFYLNQKIKSWSEHTVSDNSYFDKSTDDPVQEKTQEPALNNESIVNQPEYSNEPNSENPGQINNNNIPTTENENHQVEDPNQWKRELSGNTLVSCQTQIQNCEPQQDQHFEDGTVATFCVTYARNCTNPESIQRTWENEEVFRPAVPEPENNNPSNSGFDQNYPEQIPPVDPIAPVDPSTYLPPTPFSEPPPENHEVINPPSEY